MTRSVPRGVSSSWGNRASWAVTNWRSSHFGRLGAAFVAEQQREYAAHLGRLPRPAGAAAGAGRSQFYSCDTYNEMDPSPDTDLTADSAAVYAAMAAGDRGAVWMMQSWQFVLSRWFWSRCVGLHNTRFGVLPLPTPQQRHHP